MVLRNVAEQKYKMSKQHNSWELVLVKDSPSGLQVKCIDNWSSLMHIGCDSIEVCGAAVGLCYPQTRCIVEITDNSCLFNTKIYSSTAIKKRIINSRTCLCSYQIVAG